MHFNIVHTHTHTHTYLLMNKGVVTVSWYPPEFSDGQMESNPGFSDAALQSLLDIAHKYDMKGKKKRKEKKEDEQLPSLFQFSIVIITIADIYIYI